MPDRMLRERICTSYEVEALSWAEEVLFTRLITKLDDYGRFHGDPAIVRAAVFPLRLDRVSEKDVAAMLESLHRVRLIRVYRAEGKQYLQSPTWGKHQRIRAQKSKFPAPPDDGWPLSADDGGGGQATPDAPVFELESDSHRQSPDSDAPLTAARQRQRDPLFDALCEVCEMNPLEVVGNEAKRIGVNMAKVRNLATFTVEEIHVRGGDENWAAVMGDATKTPSAICTNWARLNGSRRTPRRQSQDDRLVSAIKEAERREASGTEHRPALGA